MSKATMVSSQNFQSRVLESKVPVLVDFYADWCGPCRAMAPVMDELAEEAGEQLHVVKVDIDASQDLAYTYNIQSIPAVLLFADGKVLDRWVGIEPKEHILGVARRHLSVVSSAETN